jgi:hypothetical protein
MGVVEERHGNLIQNMMPIALVGQVEKFGHEGCCLGPEADLKQT